MTETGLRLRLGPSRTILIPGVEPLKETDVHPTSLPAPPAAHPPPPGQASSVRPEHIQLASWPGKPLIALVEGSPCGADDLALTLMHLAESSGLRVALVSLEPQNRLGLRLGHPATSSGPGWGDNPGGQVRPVGPHLLVPAPDREDWLDPERILACLDWVRNQVDATVVDLGCRWEPRLFRPVMEQARHIWVLTRAEKGMALEMRLEQAEFSGWTDMKRVQSLVLGGSPRGGALSWGSYAVPLPDASGDQTRAFIQRELGGSVR
ncbi:MAG: hypothetical protein ACOY94_18540 [Bacillota bacterium]